MGLPTEDVEQSAAPLHGAFLTRLARGTVNAAPTSSVGADAPPEPAIRGSGDVPRWIEWLLRIPLPVKLVGANVVLFIAATITALVARQRELSAAPVLAVVITAFLAALLLNTVLILLAVRPLRVLERTVDSIWHGDLGARVPTSMLADRHVTRVARMFNILLDGLVSDRARMRRLATEVIQTADAERAALSRDLHDSAAQSLAALVMQLGVAARSADTIPPDVLRQRIEDARALATSTLEEVRHLAHTTHPRVLDDLGLIAALRRLARDTTDHLANYPAALGQPRVVVEVAARDGTDADIPAPVASVLYRVAQEAVQNARRHAMPTRILITFGRDHEHADIANIEIADDGRGFDPAATRESRSGIGLFTMRERVALVDGDFRISSRPGATSVSASVPLGHAPNPPLTRFHT